MAKTKTLSIRLALEGGGKVRSSFIKVGNEGERALKRISHASKPASMGLKAVDTSARALNGVLRQGVALIGGLCWDTWHHRRPEGYRQNRDGVSGVAYST